MCAHYKQRRPNDAVSKYQRWQDPFTFKLPLASGKQAYKMARRDKKLENLVCTEIPRELD